MLRYSTIFWRYDQRLSICYSSERSGLWMSMKWTNCGIKKRSLGWERWKESRWRRNKKRNSDISTERLKTLNRSLTQSAARIVFAENSVLRARADFQDGDVWRQETAVKISNGDQCWASRTVTQMFPGVGKWKVSPAMKLHRSAGPQEEVKQQPDSLSPLFLRPWWPLSDSITGRRLLP